ncbi:MAG: BlaI/MecI/CopY family transcriptional regulator [Candidatus Poribacteria bacterium]|nr:BlaI/MecI/CopY family transcriptional regulator [Candidatus Poribacteria bacterium]
MDTHIPHRDLSRRERQIMNIVYRRGRASVADVLAELEDSPSYSAVRAMMRILEEKGHLRHEKERARFIYTPVYPRQDAGESALKIVFQTFFDNSIEKTIAALLNVSDTALSDEESNRLAALIEQAKSGQDENS